MNKDILINQEAESDKQKIIRIITHENFIPNDLSERLQTVFYDPKTRHCHIILYENGTIYFKDDQRDVKSSSLYKSFFIASFIFDGFDISKPNITIKKGAYPHFKSEVFEGAELEINLYEQILEYFAATLSGEKNGDFIRNPNHEQLKQAHTLERLESLRRIRGEIEDEEFLLSQVLINPNRHPTFKSQIDDSRFKISELEAEYLSISKNVIRNVVKNKEPIANLRHQILEVISDRKKTIQILCKINKVEYNLCSKKLREDGSTEDLEIIRHLGKLDKIYNELTAELSGIESN